MTEPKRSEAGEDRSIEGKGVWMIIEGQHIARGVVSWSLVSIADGVLGLKHFGMTTRLNAL